MGRRGKVDVSERFGVNFPDVCTVVTIYRKYDLVQKEYLDPGSLRQYSEWIKQVQLSFH
jgi:hypothetical protein